MDKKYYIVNNQILKLITYSQYYTCYVTGQIMIYMNYIDENIKTIEENQTVGIIICKQDNEYVIKYCSDDRIISREYELV